MSTHSSKSFKQNNSNPQIRMILLFSLGIPLTSWQKSGLAHRERNYYQRFIQQGHKVSLLTYGKNDLQYSEFWKPIKILPWLGRLNHFVKYAFIAPFYHWRAFRQANIVKSNQSQGALVGAVGKLINPKLKFIVRCGWVRTKEMIIEDEKRTGLRYKRAVFTEWLGFKLADKIIVVTQSDADYIINNYAAKPAKIVILPNSINTQQYQYKQQLSNFSKQINILMVGRLAAMKNFDLALNAIELFKNASQANISVSIAGDGEERQRLENLSNKLGLAVTFYGSVNNDELPNIYQQHDIVILPEAYGSGMPKVLLESMASGAIILASNTRSAQQLIRHGENGYICQATTKELLSNLKHISQQAPTKLDTIRNTARSDIESKYSMTACIDKEIQLHQSLL